MKTYSNLFAQIIDEDNIERAIINASKRKRHRGDVAHVLRNPDYHIKKVRQMLENGTYKAHVDNVCVINEGTHNKVRRIRKPRFKYDQIIHHCVIQVLRPIFEKPMYIYSCGSIPGRGSHYGKKAIEKWLKNDVKNTKYVLKLDIKHFYDSIDQKVLKNMLKEKIHDWRTLELLYEIIDGCEKGLPLGNYTSQWFANFMLTPLDHYIKETLGAKYYVRYMDDIVIFGSNKKQLHKIFIKIKEYLRDKLHLRVKENWQVFRFEYKSKGRPLDFMGFKFYRNRTTLRRSIYFRILKKARLMKKRVTIKGAYAMVSYMGYIKTTDTYMVYWDYIRPCVNIGKLKKFISKRAKKEVMERENQMETGYRLPTGTA